MNTTWTVRGAVWIGLVLLVFGMAVAAQSSLPAAAELQPGWNRLEPDGATCADGSPYAFFVRPGDPAKLTVYFQGGGACWDRGTCGGPLGPYDRGVGEVADEIGAAGVFDFEDARNPIRDHTVVFISYCTGDVHAGSRTVTFEGDPPVTVRFHGYDNATMILDWTQANFPDAQQVFVTGSSAGAVGAIYNAGRIFAAYPNATQRLLGDAFIGVTPANWAGFDQWGVTDHLPANLSEEAVADGGLLTALAAHTAATFPDSRVAQYTTVADQTQVFFFGLMGGDRTAWTPLMRAALAPLDAVENARSFVAPGRVHVILPRPEYYTVAGDGVALADWLPAWLAGEDVPSVLCAECQ